MAPRTPVSRIGWNDTRIGCGVSIESTNARSCSLTQDTRQFALDGMDFWSPEVVEWRSGGTRIKRPGVVRLPELEVRIRGCTW